MAVVVITGCGSGIGLETTLAFARRGDRVIALVRSLGRAGHLRASVASERLDVRVDELDVTDGDAVADVIGRILAEEDRIDVLINNAGFGAAGVVEEMDEQIARAIVETNLWGPFRVSRAVLPAMRRAGGGVIVNVSSITARRSSNPGFSIYGMSKHALSFLSETLRDEVATMGIRVIAAEPGFVATDIFNKSRVAINESSPYTTLLTHVDSTVAAAVAGGTSPALIAAEIVAAVDDPTGAPRVPMGDDARSWFGGNSRLRSNQTARSLKGGRLRPDYEPFTWMSPGRWKG
jgi:NAD(P)-dependent dehydrogenase (short-subunit alcohol dehydrogenase family)